MGSTLEKEEDAPESAGHVRGEWYKNLKSILGLHYKRTAEDVKREKEKD